MPTFLGVLTLDEQPSGQSIEEAGAALLVEHNGTSVGQASVLLGSNGVAAACNGTTPNGTGTPNKTSPIKPTPWPVPEGATPLKPTKKIVTNRAIVLENASHGFIRPNIMDVKLGVRLWADDAAEEKRIRFDKVAAETTHRDLGFRVAGMRVWPGPGAKGDDVDEEGYKIYDKNYGRFFLRNDNVHEAFQHFMFAESAGVDEELGKLVAQAFLADVQRIQTVLEEQESRMYSASLLFVFEGDGEALRRAMEEASRDPPTPPEGAEEDEDEDEDELQGPKIYSVKVIDFAHATWTPGEGPDENSLKGVRSIGQILENLSAAT